MGGSTGVGISGDFAFGITWTRVGKIDVQKLIQTVKLEAVIYNKLNIALIPDYGYFLKLRSYFDSKSY